MRSICFCNVIFTKRGLLCCPSHFGGGLPVSSVWYACGRPGYYCRSFRRDVLRAICSSTRPLLRRPVAPGPSSFNAFDMGCAAGLPVSLPALRLFCVFPHMV